MNNIFGRVFLKGILGGFAFQKVFFGSSVNGKVFLGVIPKYPTPLIPVCMFINSTAWANEKVLATASPESDFNQEEADKRIFPNAFHGAQNGHSSVIVKSLDTDVEVLAL